MRISELPQEIKEKALEYQRNETNVNYCKKTDSLSYSFDWRGTNEGFKYWSDLESNTSISVTNPYELMQPIQYQIGIDTFTRMEANCSKDDILAFCKGNIDKYNWRKKGSDLDDFKKIIDYANFAIKQLNK